MDINLAYYQEKDWDRLMQIIDDRKSMHKSWDEWYKAFLKTEKFLISEGFKVKRIVVDLNELRIYCETRGIKNDGKARSQFVQAK